MTLLYLQGFEGFPASGDREDLDLEFDFVDNVATTEAGITTGYGTGQAAFVHNDNNTETALRLPIAGLSSQDDWIVGLRFYTDYNYYRAFLIESPILEFRNCVNGGLLGVSPVSAGYLRVRNGAGTVLANVSRNLTTRVWHYLEVKVKFHATTGSFEVRLNGETVASGSNVNTVGTATQTRPTMLYLGNAGDAVKTRVDDIYICDDQGATHNDFLGDITIRRLSTSGAGNSTQFTPSIAMANWLLVRDLTGTDDDTTYVQSDTATEKDTYAFTDISDDPASFKAVAVNSYCKKSDAGSRNFVHVARSSTTETDSSVIYPAAAQYRYLQSLYTVDPNTSAAWTKAGLNAAEFGFKVNA